MDRLRNLIKDKYDIKINHLDHRIKDYDFDSLDLVELCLYVEDEFKINISDEKMKELITFRDIMNLIDISNRTFHVGQEIVYRQTDEIYKVTKVHSSGYEIARICNLAEHETYLFFDLKSEHNESI